MNKKICFLFAAFFAVSCSHNVKKSELNKNYEIEIVEAEGTAPVMNGDLEGAKKSSLSDAMKNALALVIGVYVSGDTLVAKSVLIDDSITSRSEGYIEKYKVLKEYRDGEFYKTKVQAHVRKEDLSAKLRNLETDVERIGNPIVCFKVAEKISGQPSPSAYASNHFISKLREDGFRINQAPENADITVKGTVNASFNTREGLAGFISYGSALSLELLNQTGEIIGAVNESAGGMGVTEEVAAKESMVNAARKSYDQFKEAIMGYYREKKIISFKAGNVKSINQVNELIKYFRNIPVIKDSVLKNFSGNNAVIDILMRKGNSNEIMPALSRSDKFSVVRTSPAEIVVEMK
ncbi:MAG: hypothetical protein COT17_07080 [Elusimicrobia bacterium CG08_land_8_20_14_0_20_51_18]|nr:MAG: hypothetical protein COT17_07080 [Elusimicrobia bacterium CG08_land_8_20_14_0_20_51_18]